ncbi:hypothetical protein NEOC95_000875 [Neochlamydia sp. AcF95]|nr:hypothetical protein [Neochlamydia sp. AcF95]
MITSFPSFHFLSSQRFTKSQSYLKQSLLKNILLFL